MNNNFIHIIVIIYRVTLSLKSIKKRLLLSSSFLESYFFFCYFSYQLSAISNHLICIYLYLLFLKPFERVFTCLIIRFDILIPFIFSSLFLLYALIKRFSYVYNYFWKEIIIVRFT